MDFNIPNTVLVMKKENRLNTIVWVALIALICVSVLFSENELKYSFLLITALSFVKFISVSFQFVEVKHAHVVWKLLSVFFALVYLVGVVVLY